jgi:carboxyl-terminal processing protease
MRLFIFEQLEKDRPYYNSLSMEQFKNEVTITDAVIEDFISFARFRKITLKASNYKELYRRYLKATMAGQLFGNNAFEMMVNQEDDVIKKVIALSKEE